VFSVRFREEVTRHVALFLALVKPRRVVLLVLIGLALTQINHYWSLLPNTVATHFDLAGHPNGYSSKRNAVILELSTVLGIPVLFSGIAFLLRWLPASLVNIPNRAIWLAPEHRKETNAYLTRWVDWQGNLCLTFFLCLFQAIWSNNLSLSTSTSGRPHSLFLWLPFSLYVLGTLALVIILFHKFSTKP